MLNSGRISGGCFSPPNYFIPLLRTEVLIASSDTGLYQQAETFLYRVDPRMKVFSCLLLVALSFSASGWLQLLLLISFIVLAAWSVGPLAMKVFPLFRMLRWLLLFTLLMHLFLSPGRTLWGQVWLSFDGLLAGLFVCLQVLLAVACSFLLAVTTSTASLVLAFGWVVQPLGVLGCRTDDWQRTLSQAIGFIPIVHEEISLSGQADVETAEFHDPAVKQGRFHLWGMRLQRLVFRLVDRGDEIAYRLTVEGATSPGHKQLPPFWPLALLDQLFAAIIFCMILSYWLAG